MLAFIDNGGSFDRLLREAEEAANGDQELKMILLEKRIIEDFVNAASGMVKENGPVHVDNLGCYIPKRLRSGVGSVKVAPALSTDILEVAESKKSLKRRCGFDEEQEVMRKPPPKVMKMTKKIMSLPQPEVGSDPHAEMPQAFMDCIQEMKGRHVLLVMQKEITESDLNKTLNHQSIPRKKIQTDLLNQEERKTLDAKQGILVLLLQPSMEITEMPLKKWVVTSTYCYNLVDRWRNEVVKNHKNKLVKGCMVQLWCFRIYGKLCFALVNI